MIHSKGYAARKAKGELAPFAFQRRDPGPCDIVIEIRYCGVCHSDIHQVNNDWGFSQYPMVPGHEIVGDVTVAGSAVKKFAVGDRAAVGCLVDSCRTCEACREGEEQYCGNGPVFTYGSPETQTGGLTFGGYSNNIVVDEAFALKVSPQVDFAATAPLLCAGITTYSPLRHWQVGPGKTIGVIGLGGLGHMALKLGRAFGAHVVQFTTSAKKREDALRMGAHEVVLSTDPNAMAAQAGRFDFVLDTVSAPHDLNALIATLKRDGDLVLVGLPGQPAPVDASGLILRRRKLGGSVIGGIRETQEMLDFCAEKGITCDIEMTPIQKINEAFVRTIKADVKFRFVIDMASLQER